jgi:hypothetical protein
MSRAVPLRNLFEKPLKVVNVGLLSFKDSIQTTGAEAIQIDWTPPANADAELGMKLARLVGHPLIEKANEEAFQRYLSAQPVLTGVATAADAIPDLKGKTILHAGPPVEWEQMCGPLRGAVLGAALFEGWAANLEEAETLASSRGIEFSPCHHHSAVGPMTGVLSPSMPLWEVTNTDRGNRSFSNMNEGLGKVLRFGANSPEVIERLVWMRDVLAPIMRSTISIRGGLELKPLMAQALHMGDEVHNRNVAATSLFIRRVLGAMLDSGAPSSDLAQAAEFISGNDHFFLNISMAACKAMLDAAHGIEHSTMVTVMSRNGTEFGIRVSGCGDAWFTAPAPLVDGLYFPGYTIDDAAPDIGDSAITETAGVGGFAMATAPAIVKFVGGTPQDALEYTRRMYTVTLGSNSAFTLPSLGFAGTPAGIDTRKVVDTGILPIINTGIAHRDAGVGQVGAGVTHAPLACFIGAVSHLAERVQS